VGLVLIVVGIVVWLLLSPLIGLILVVVGLALLFVPHTGGYSDWRTRRGP
jgi:Flp pilus assembly protein TadB